MAIPPCRRCARLAYSCADADAIPMCWMRSASMYSSGDGVSQQGEREDGDGSVGSAAEARRARWRELQIFVAVLAFVALVELELTLKTEGFSLGRWQGLTHCTHFHCPHSALFSL